jgi:hypothetical protein
LLPDISFFGEAWEIDAVLRKDNRRQALAEETMRILNTYSELLVAYPHHFLDASWLPADKQKIIEIFKVLLSSGPPDESQKKLENWWCLLSRFQPGVGAMPITYEILKDNPPVKEWYERIEQTERWLEIAVAELEVYEREIERFKVKMRRILATPKNRMK